MLAVSEDWVREHAAELGAIRVGDGPRVRCASTPVDYALRSSAGGSNGRGSRRGARRRHGDDRLVSLPGPFRLT